MNNFDNVYFTCKPTTLSEISETVSLKDNPGIDKLDTYLASEIWAAGEMIHGDFLLSAEELGQYFVVRVGATHLLVNTEGYGYARYASKIVA